MKKVAFLFILILIVACKKKVASNEQTTAKTAQTPEQLGREIFEDKAGCVACHQLDQKIVGPSIQEIAAAYKGKTGEMVTFLKGNGKPIVDPSQYDVMEANFAITKAMTDAELQGIEAYISSQSK